MRSIKKYSRALAAGLGASAVSAGIFGIEGASSFLLLHFTVATLISVLFLRFLKSWLLYVTATVASTWLIVSLLILGFVTAEPFSGANILSLPALAGMGALIFHRQVLFGFVVFVVLDLVISKFLTRAAG